MILGIDGKIYRNTGTYGSPVWNEIPNCKDLSLNIEAAEADVTTRGNGGWEAVAAALLKGSIEFGMLYDTSDADYTALQTAFLARTAIEFAVMDGSMTSGAHKGFRMTCAILKFGRSEKNTEAMMTEVSLKPTYAANAPSALTGTA